MNVIPDIQKKYCKDTIFRLNKAQVGHFISYERYHRTGKILGIMAALLTSLTSMLIIFEYGKNNTKNYNSIILVSSILATLVTSLYTYLGLEDRALSHKDRAQKYGVLKRRVERFLSVQSESFEELTKAVEIEWSHISENAPVTPRKNRSKAKEVLKEDHEDFKKYEGMRNNEEPI